MTLRIAALVTVGNLLVGAVAWATQSVASSLGLVGLLY
jgi:hypothetical protein